MRSVMQKMIDPVQMLVMDHKSVAGLFEQYDRTQDRQARQGVRTEICLDLTIHATLEEEIFYPAVRRHLQKEGEQFVENALKEHRAIKGLIQELQGMEPGTELFTNRLHALRDTVQDHVYKEEHRIFPQANSLPLRELALAMDARRAQLMMQMPPPSAMTFLAMGLLIAGVGLLLLQRRR